MPEFNTLAFVSPSLNIIHSKEDATSLVSCAFDPNFCVSLPLESSPISLRFLLPLRSFLGILFKLTIKIHVTSHESILILGDNIAVNQIFALALFANLMFKIHLVSGKQYLCPIVLIHR